MAQLVGKIAESDGPCQCIDCGAVPQSTRSNAAKNEHGARRQKTMPENVDRTCINRDTCSCNCRDNECGLTDE